MSTREPLTRLSCRYHGWSWNTDGSLRAAPSTDLYAGDPCWALDQLPIATWGPMLFVKPSHDGPDFDTVMGPLVAEIGSRVDVDALVPMESETFSVKSNWKVWIENFNECYHCAVAHPEFTKLVHTNRRYEVERLGTYSVGHRVPLRAEPDKMFYFAWAWPTFALGVVPGRQQPRHHRHPPGLGRHRRRMHASCTNRPASSTSHSSPTSTRTSCSRTSTSARWCSADFPAMPTSVVVSSSRVRRRCSCFTSWSTITCWRTPRCDAIDGAQPRSRTLSGSYSGRSWRRAGTASP